jgi:hypothetical protein
VCFTGLRGRATNEIGGDADKAKKTSLQTSAFMVGNVKVLNIL